MKKILLIIGALFFGYSVFAQNNELPNDPAVRKGKLDNGLTYYIMKNSQPAQRAEFYLATNVGAIQETPDQDGLAHFLEHMCFNGTKNFPGKGILDYLQSIGASFGGNVNAATGVEQTTYMLNNIPLVRPTVIDTCILIMHDYSHFVTCAPEEIDAERGVIIEERRSRRNAAWRMYEKSKKYIYGDSKYADCSLIGSQENLETFKPESLTNFYHTWYRPDLQALIVVGDIDPDYVEAAIKRIFSDIPAAENPKPKDVIMVPDNQEPVIGIITDPEAVGTKVEVYWKNEAMPEQYNSTVQGKLNDLLKMIVSSVMTERLDDIAAKPDAPFTSAAFAIGNMCETMEVDMGQISCHEGESVEAFKAFLTEIEKMVKFGFTSDEISRAKDEILSIYESAAKQASTRKNAELVQPLIDNFFDNYSYMEPEAEYETVKQILSMLNDQIINQVVSQVIPENNMVVLYEGPEKEGVATPSADDFSKAIAEVEASEIKANEDVAIASDFLDASKLKGSVVKSTANGLHGSTVWVLKNGLKVILKPSDNEKDRIIFNLYKNGGEAMIPTEDLPSFDDNIWGGFLSCSGISKFPSTVVTKMLAGKNLSVSPYIGSTRHGVSGSCTPKDLETALQLTYLYFADPRFDQAEYDQAVNKLNAVISNYVKQPRYKLSVEIAKSLYGDNPRHVTISEDVLSKASLATIEKDYRMLFNDAAGATVVIGGDFDINTIKPLVEKYLGSIKKGKKPFVWKYEIPQVNPGKVDDDFKVDMQTPKVTVLELFTADFPEYKVAYDVALSAASYILDMRYTKSLREDEGGTYGASTYGDFSIQPKVSAMFQIYFDTKPSAADKLVSLSLEGLNSLANEGPTQEEFDMTVKNLQKNIPESRLSTKYWVDVLRQNELYGYDYDTEYEAAVKDLKPSDIQNVLKSILASGSVKTVIMRPDVTAEAE